MKDYFGMTVDFERRILQHGGRVLRGSENPIIENIKDRRTARGVEQLFIERGRKIGEIANEVNSVNPKSKQYGSIINDAIDYFKKHHNDLEVLWKDR